MKHRVVRLTIAALGLVLSISTGAVDSVQARQQSRVYATKHHAGAYTARRVCCDGIGA